MIISIPVFSFIIYQLYIMDIKTYYISLGGSSPLCVQS
jgi:hypothetical protein